MSPVDLLTQRLEGVRQHGAGWRANCPNGHSSKGTLSLGEGDDGRVLVTCFAGCSAADIMAPLGLSLADLYPERIRDASPAGRSAARRANKEAGWAAALRVLVSEASVMLVVAGMVGRGEPLAPCDIERVRVAGTRIDIARGVLL